jgi:glycosyltransferase involved in cell wall biosynthesis
MDVLPKLSRVSSRHSPRFAMIIPVYNHGNTIRSVVKEALTLGWPVFVVNDGSQEDIASKIKDLCGVRLLCHKVNQGKGAALMTGFKAALNHADFAVTIDADGQHHPEDAQALMAAIVPGKRPIVVGHRTLMDQPDTPWTSRFGRTFSNFWIRMAGGPEVGDTQSGFRIYPLPDVLELKVSAGGYQFELEVLVKAARRKITVLEEDVRVTYPPAGQRISHFHPFLDFMRNSKMFARLIFQRIIYSTTTMVKK